jgi:16S rRNA processing protein RimM
MIDPKTKILMGVFGAAHGIQGQVRLKSYTGDPMAVVRYGPFTTGTGRVIELNEARERKEVLVVRVEGVNDRNGAEALNGMQLYVPRERLGLAEEEDEFFHADLVGLRAEYADGMVAGTVTALHNYGGGDVIEIKPEQGPSFFLAFTKVIVPTVDIAGRRIVIDPPAEIEVKGE